MMTREDVRNSVIYWLESTASNERATAAHNSDSEIFAAECILFAKEYERAARLVRADEPEVERLKAELAVAREELTRIDSLCRSTLSWAGKWPPSPGMSMHSVIGVVAKLEGRPYADVQKSEESCHAATEAIRAGKAIS